MMSHNVVHLAWHCKKFNEIVTALCRNRTIKKSKYHQCILAGFECCTNSIVFITLLNCRIKYFLTYSFSERFLFTIFVNKWHFQIFTVEISCTHLAAEMCVDSLVQLTNWFPKICFKFTMKWQRVWPLFNAHIIWIHCTALSQSELLLYPKNCVVGGFLEQV